MEQTSKSSKRLETVLVSVVIVIICWILFPSIIKIYNYSIKSTNETNTESAIKYAKDLYATLNLYTDVDAPFKIEFYDGGYKLYSNGVEFTPINNVSVDAKRELPKSGYIVVNADGTAIAQKLSYIIGGYICNEIEDNRPVCKKE